MRAVNRRLWTPSMQTGWHRKFLDTDLPAWYRLHCLAHAYLIRGTTFADFMPGEIASSMLVRGKVGVVPIDKGALSRGLSKAKDKGYLHDDSTTLCLILPDRFVAELSPRTTQVVATDNLKTR